MPHYAGSWSNEHHSQQHCQPQRLSGGGRRLLGQGQGRLSGSGASTLAPTCPACCAADRQVHGGNPHDCLHSIPLSPDLLPLQNKPDLYMYGMLCALLATGIWLIVATYFEVS